MPTVTLWYSRDCAPCMGTLRGVVPTLEGEGVRVELADLHWHPCAARERRIDYLPTITVDADDGTELFRCRGYPTDEAVDRITEAYGGGTRGGPQPTATSET